MRRSAFDVVSGALDRAQAVTQEAIETNAPTSDLPVPRGRNMVAGAGIGTLIFLVFFLGLAWVLGNLTGEALFSKVEQVAS